MATTTTFTFTDLDLNFGQNPITKDINILRDRNAVKNSMINLILTKPFETPFHPEISSQVNSILFELMSPITDEIVKATIIQVINKFEPRVSLYSVNVNGVADTNQYNISIVYNIIGNTTPLTLNLTLSNIR